MSVGEINTRIRRPSTPGANGQILFNKQGVDGASAGLTFDYNTNSLTRPVLKAQKEIYANDGLINQTNVNIDCSLGSWQDIMLLKNSNLTFQNCATANQTTTFTLFVRQSANGSNTLSYSNTIRWSDNVVPTLTTTASFMDVLQFITYNGGTFWFGSQVMANIPKADVY